MALGALSFAAPPGPRASVLLGIRAEDLSLAGEGDGFPFVLRVAEPLGPHVLLTGTVAGQMLRAVVPDGCAVRAGRRDRICGSPADRLRWMDAETGDALEQPA